MLGVTAVCGGRLIGGATPFVSARKQLLPKICAIPVHMSVGAAVEAILPFGTGVRPASYTP